MKGVFARAHRILDDNRDILERCAAELLARETLDENAIRELTRDVRRPDIGEMATRPT